MGEDRGLGGVGWQGQGSGEVGWEGQGSGGGVAGAEIWGPWTHVGTFPPLSFFVFPGNSEDYSISSRGIRRNCKWARLEMGWLSAPN